MLNEFTTFMWWALFGFVMGQLRTAVLEHIKQNRDNCKFLLLNSSSLSPCSSSHLSNSFPLHTLLGTCHFPSLTFTMPVTLSACLCTWNLLLSVWPSPTHSLCLGAHSNSWWVGGQAEGPVHISSGHSWGLEGQTRETWTQCHPQEREGTVCLFPSGPKTAQQSSERYRGSSRGYVESECRLCLLQPTTQASLL